MAILYKNAVIVWANNFQFKSGQVMQFKQVYSRMLLWCKSGTGMVTINGEKFELKQGTYLMIPWKHAIRYEADSKHPFLVAGIHIIPNHHRNSHIIFTAVHSSDDPLARSPARKDLVIPGLEMIRKGSYALAPALYHLAEYCVMMFDHFAGNENFARAVSTSLLETITYSLKTEVSGSDTWPESLVSITEFINTHIQEPLSLSNLCTFSRLCPSAVGRLFKKHTEKTPVQYITDVKLMQAKELLSTTALPVSEIGERIGIPDLYYFSKLFRKHEGINPLGYRRREMTI
jgi:AraC-like DNA-binding protein